MGVRAVTFGDIAGQERAAALLNASLRRGMLSHACLLVGPPGVGRLGMARELAAVLLCTQSDEKACGRCESCRLYRKGAHPDYEEVGVPEGKQKLLIDLIRTLQETAAVKPHVARGRVFVVRDTERMSIEAANCFLKTLEEPPGECRFILVAGSLWDIPPTVVSRCQIIKLSGLAPARVEEALRAEGVQQEDAWWLARRSWGSPGLARALGDMALPAFNRELCGRLLKLEPKGAFALTDWLCAEADGAGRSSADARAALQELLECAAVLYRDLAAVAVASGEAEVFNRDLEDTLREFASRRPLDSIIERADRVFETIERIGANANRRLALDDLFVSLAATSSPA